MKIMVGMKMNIKLYSPNGCPGAPGNPKGEGEPDVLLTRCSGKSLRDLSRLQSREKTKGLDSWYK
jgi:hypothetical protein